MDVRGDLVAPDGPVPVAGWVASGEELEVGSVADPLDDGELLLGLVGVVLEGREHPGRLGVVCQGARPRVARMRCSVALRR